MDEGINYINIQFLELSFSIKEIEKQIKQEENNDLNFNNNFIVLDNICCCTLYDKVTARPVFQLKNSFDDINETAERLTEGIKDLKRELKGWKFEDVEAIREEM